MNEKETNVVDTVETTDNDNNMYIDEIKRLKSETVSKERYAKLEADNKRLLEEFTNQQPDVEVTPTGVVPTVEDLASLLNDINSGKLKNLDYVKDQIEYRKKYIALYGIDPAASDPTGNDYARTHETAENVFAALEHCLDYCEGDSALFTQELQRILR